MNYTSQGTIRVHQSFGSGNSETTLFFIPENDYAIKHGNKTFAVFVPQSCSCTPQSCRRAIIRKYDRDKGNGVKIRVVASSCTEIISDAAVHQKKVKVWVRAKLEGAGENEILEAACQAVKAKTKNEKERTKAIEDLVETVNKWCSTLKLIGITVPAK